MNKDDAKFGRSKGTLWYFTFRIFFAHIIIIIAMVILAVLLNAGLEAGIYGQMTMRILGTVICFAGYAYIVYTEAWKVGIYDQNRVLYNRADYDRFKAVKAAILSQIPGIALAVMVQVSHSEQWVRYANFYYANFTYVLTIARENSARWVYFVPPLFASLAVLGYHVGYKQARLSDRLLFKKR
ncbi:MAG: hypothetical protein LBN97_06565 [Oscillospiraceae bacterium]|nr:hypothetical protein [Oscillospiraceae bacterium]